MISELYPKGYPHCRKCGKVLEDCGCDSLVDVYFPEVGEVRDAVSRVSRVLDTVGTPLVETEHWIEARSCPGNVLHIHLGDGGKLPDIYVGRGTQMYKLKWPELPAEDKTIVARPDV